MSDAARRIADAILYEGYLLWPYRASAPKNRQRWTFGCVMPPPWTEEHPEEPSSVSTEVLVECDRQPVVQVCLRFLHSVRRQLFDPSGAAVDRLGEGDALLVSATEATEREIAAPHAFQVAPGLARDITPLGIIERSWRAVHGDLALVVAPLAAGIWHVRATVANTTIAMAADSHHAADGTARAHALSHALCSAHLVLQIDGGGFISPLDARAAEACTQHKLWPVLVGESPDRSTVFASEIMLDQYPQIAPESTGDFFDGGEIDQLLALNIMALTDEERSEMRATDPRSRAILERTEAMSSDALMRLHGTMRDKQTSS
ncbi:MAG TPA: hypothetical protein VHW65_08845 [Gemmatimonadales bacterium]|nr:hypothetical protein [Gemmatimonadales bacterium]